MFLSRGLNDLKRVSAGVINSCKDKLQSLGSEI